MAEEKKQKTIEKAQVSKRPQEQEYNEVLVRIYGYDIAGSKNLYTGLTKIKGISWSVANAICVMMKLDRRKKIEQLSKPEIAQIEAFLDDMKIPFFLKNRRIDLETGDSNHYLGTDIDMKRDFDIKRLKAIKSYKGVRHALHLPVRGQRTRSHFRTKSRATGIRKAGGVKK